LNGTISEKRCLPSRGGRGIVVLDGNTGGFKDPMFTSKKGRGEGIDSSKAKAITNLEKQSCSIFEL